MSTLAQLLAYQHARDAWRTAALTALAEGRRFVML